MTNMSDKYDKYEVCSSLAEKRGGSWLPEVTAAISLISQLQKLQKVQKGKQDREKSVIERIYIHNILPLREKGYTPTPQRKYGRKMKPGILKNDSETIAHPATHAIVQEISTLVVEPTNTGRAQFLLLPKLKREIGSIKWGGQ